jgi:hypothetical protein
MSHFRVLVIGDDYEKQLAPYHQFECTGRDDKYVQDIDVLDEQREIYERDTTHAIQIEGNWVCIHDAKTLKPYGLTPKVWRR